MIGGSVIVSIQMSEHMKKKVEEIANLLETSFSEIVRRSIIYSLPELEKQVEVAKQLKSYGKIKSEG